jgi:hypothetical protein
MLHFFLPSTTTTHQSHNHALYYEHKWSQFSTVMFTTFYIYDVCITTLMDLFTRHFRHDKSCQILGESASFPMCRVVQRLFWTTLNVDGSKKSTMINVFLIMKMVTSHWIRILKHIVCRVRHRVSFQSQICLYFLLWVSVRFFRFPGTSVCVCVCCV